jgi:hypothetical protein
MALQLGPPTFVEAETSGTNRDSFPAWARVRFAVPARGARPALDLYWCNGSIIVAEKATLYTPGDFCSHTHIIGMDRDALPAVPYARSPGHFEEFAGAIKGGPEPVSNFPNYAGPLTEFVLVGNLAIWAAGSRVTWDSETMTATGAPGLDALIRPVYRKGYRL